MSHASEASPLWTEITKRRVYITNIDYGYIGGEPRLARYRRISEPWMVYQGGSRSRTFATFAEAVEFVNTGSWS